jgi:hypothetical protein
MYCVLFLHNTVCVWPQLQVIELGGLRKDGLGGGIDAVGSAGVGGEFRSVQRARVDIG